jgi:maleate cis-trans isomerase
MPKIGCISPSIVQLPWDLSDVLPDGVSAIVATLNNRNGQPGEEERSNAAVPQAVNVLVDEGAQAIVGLGIPNAARRGYDADRVLFEELGRARSVPIVSSLLATILACKHLGTRHPLLVTQYDEVANDMIVTYCGAAGLPIEAAVGLGCRTAADVNAKGPSDYDRLARETVPHVRNCDAVVIFARGNMLSIARTLEAELNIAVIEQTLATVWWSMSQFGLPCTSGHGKLLSSGTASPALAV